MPGIHMVPNAVLAVAAARVFGMALERCAEGIGKLRLTKGRLEQKIIRGIHILDDSYNANPDSMYAAIRTLCEIPAAGGAIAVLGRMGELGGEAERGHKQVGRGYSARGIGLRHRSGSEAKWITDTAWRGGVEKVLHFKEIGRCG